MELLFGIVKTTLYFYVINKLNTWQFTKQQGKQYDIHHCLGLLINYK